MDHCSEGGLWLFGLYRCLEPAQQVLLGLVDKRCQQSFSALEVAIECADTNARPLGDLPDLGVQAATGKTVTAITYVFASARVETSPGDPQALAAAALAAEIGRASCRERV